MRVGGAAGASEEALETATAQFGDSFSLHHSALLDLLGEHVSRG